MGTSLSIRRSAKDYANCTKTELIALLRDMGEKISTLEGAEPSESNENIEKQLSRFCLDNLQRPVLWMKRDGGIVYANNAASRSWGYSSSKLLTMRFWDLDTNCPAERWKEKWFNTKEHMVSTFNSRLRTFDGRKIPYEVEVFFTRVDGEEFICAIANIECSLALIEKRFEFERDFANDLIENAKVLICVLDRDDRFIYINPYMEKASGYALHDIIGRQWIQTLIPKADQKAASELFRKVICAMDVAPETFPIVTKDGKVLIIEWFDSVRRDINGETVGYYVVGRDITSRKMAEDALLISEEKFRTLAENSSDFIMRCDEQMRIIYVNPAGIALLKLDFAEILGKSFHELGIAADVSDVWENKLSEVFKSGSSQQCLYELKHGKTAMLVDWRATPEFSPDGEIRSVLCVSRDITALKRAADEKAELQAQLRQSQKMEALGRLAGGIAHDFNNLLTTIIGYCELSVRTAIDDESSRGRLEEIHRAAMSAANLTKQLLTFSRHQTGSPQIVNIKEVLLEMNRMLRRIIGDDIVLETVADDNLWDVRVDPGQIEQVIMNLAVNARDAMPDGGRLTVEVKNVNADNGFTEKYSGMVKGQYVMINVEDTGMGITNDIKSKIFEPFFTTKEAGKGTGLGLSTVYGIVKQSGGVIQVYSQPDRGTVFEIYLPKAESETVKVGEEISRTDIPKGTEEILVVEDHDSVRKLTVEILEKQGYRVYSARNGQEAYEISRNREVPIQLLIADVVMPGMSGVDLYELVSRRWPETKVLYMSGFAPQSVIQREVFKNKKIFIQKPFNPANLAAKVREVLDG